MEIGLLTTAESTELMVRTELGLWEVVSRSRSAEALREHANGQFAVDPTQWHERELTITDMMQLYAQDAVAHASLKHGVTLDLTEASIEQVEELLDAIWRQRPRGLLGRLRKDLSEEELDAYSKAFGGYLGEVMRRHLGGEWRDSTDLMPGQPVITLRIGNQDFYPPAKVFKRLNNGPEDNVDHYYRVFREQLHKP